MVLFNSVDLYYIVCMVSGMPLHVGGSEDTADLDGCVDWGGPEEQFTLPGFAKPCRTTTSVAVF